MKRATIIVCMLLALTGCGFEPMYAGSGGDALQTRLSGIDVAPIPERTGQILQQSLNDQLGGNGLDYRLEVALEQQEAGSGFRADEATTRINIMLIAHYRLRRLSDDQVVMETETRAFSAYDVVESEFATLTTRQDTLRGLAEELSRRITGRLVTYFRNHEDSPADEGTASRD